MNESSIITISENAIKNNISFLNKKLGKNVKISAVVKANAYGHGIEQVVPLFEKYGIEHYSVFYYSEAIRVFNSLSKPASIVVMGWIAPNKIKSAISRGIEFFVFNIERLNDTIKQAKNLGIKAKIHLEAETGMNRTGLNLEELKKAITLINENRDCIDLVGFCTHLAGAESVSNYVRIHNQLKNYKKLLEVIESHGLQPKIKHVANSAAAFVYPKARMDLVRIGIMLYGFWSSSEVFVQYIKGLKNKIDPLKRILEWRSQIMSIKTVKSGEFIGYGISFLAQEDITTALIPIGYSFGYNRSLSNKGRVLVGGKRCSVIGVVNMNMIIVNITKVENVKVGDEVVLIGKQGDLEIKVSAFGEISKELNYEILAHLSKSIKRIHIK